MSLNLPEWHQENHKNLSKNLRRKAFVRFADRAPLENVPDALPLEPTFHIKPLYFEDIIFVLSVATDRRHPIPRRKFGSL
jgi:hypothetical protein